MIGRPRETGERFANKALKRLGYRLEKRHFYSPLVEADQLPDRLWAGPASMVGVDLGIPDSLQLLNELRPYFTEFQPPLQQSVTGGFWLDNGSYGRVDAPTLYAMLRHLHPKRVYELGSGASSHVIQMARARNTEMGAELAHTIFDPFPFQASPLGPVDGVTLHSIRTEDIDPGTFDGLLAGDVLFVDTTHTVRTGGDVTHLFLEILPRIKSGVHVHIHDIFLPYEYPRAWVVGLGRAWAEQYLLQAFLAYNRAFRVTLPNYAITRAHPEFLRELLPTFDPATVEPGAFWLTRL